MTRKCKKGSYMALFTLVVIAAVIVLNLIVGKLPAKYLKHDLSSNQILTLGDTTRDILAQLDRDVTIHIVADPNSVDERITSFVNLYKDLSPHISVEANDPVLHPDVLTSLDTEPGNLIVSCESTGKKTSISFDDIIQFDPMVYYQYGQIKETAFDGEGQITSAIRYVTSDTAAAVYTLTGHGETALSSAVSDAMDKSGMKAADLNLLTQGAVPQDCSLLNGIPFVPQKLRNFPAILEHRKIQTNPL
nr:Gldg family protein [Enterocloster bolteae]